MLFLQSGHAQLSYTFTTCGATGQFGPNQALANTAYSSTNLNGSVTITGQGIQQWVVPSTGSYKIEAWGAQGGPNWGLGAYTSGEFTLTAGNTLKIIVGQQGGSSNGNHGSGGGGSFVANNITPLIVAGGGGGKGAGATATTAACHATIAVDGQTPPGGGPGGTGGGGGASASGATGGTSLTPGASSGGSTWASGGGGFYTDSGMYSSNTLFGGRAFLNGGLGGDPATSGGNSPGGFGGGGGCGDRGAGGGGYSGGGGATSNGENGGGGGSYNGGSNQTNLAGVNTGHGKVIITRLCNVSLQASKNPICVGETLTVSTDAVSNILWSDGSTSSSITISPSTNTTYIVSGQAASGCTAAVAINVTVNPLPVLSAVVVPSVLCVGNTATIVGSGANTYTWTSVASSTPVVTVNPLITTQYNYYGTNVHGCVNTSVVTVTVNSNLLGITANTTICAGETITVTANNAVTYTWSTGNNFQSTPVAPLTNTSYIAKGTDIHNCILSNSVNINIEPKPNVTATANKSTICKGESATLIGAGAETYNWGTGLGTGSVVVVSPPVDVTYNFIVSGTGSNGCTNTAVVTVVVSKCTGISTESSGNTAIKIYPNPTNGEITLEFQGSLQKTIEVTDLSGRKVISKTTNDEKMILDLNMLPAGVYSVKVSTADAVETTRIIKGY